MMILPGRDAVVCTSCDYLLFLRDFHVEVCLVGSHMLRAPCLGPLNVLLDTEQTNQRGFDGVMHWDTVQPNSPSDASSPIEKLLCRPPPPLPVESLCVYGAKLAPTDSRQRVLMCAPPLSEAGG